MKIKGPGMVLPSMVPVKVVSKPLAAQLSSTSLQCSSLRSVQSNYFLPSQNLQRRIWVAGLCLANFGAHPTCFINIEANLHSKSHSPKNNSWINQVFEHWRDFFPCWCHEGLLDSFCIFSLRLAMDKGSRIQGPKTIFPTAMGGQMKSWAGYITILENTSDIPKWPNIWIILLFGTV